MIQEFVFEKISENHKMAGVGTAGNIWIVLNELLSIDEEDELYVNMEKFKTVNSEEKPIYGTKNAWEYYFDQVDPRGKNIKKIDFFTANNRIKIFYEKHYTQKEPLFIELRRLFWKNFQLKEYLAKEIENYVCNNIRGKITLGVHVRLTDMSSNYNVKKLNDYIKKTNHILSSNREINQVFLATDDETVLTEFLSRVHKPVIFLKGIYRATALKKDVNPYDRYDYVRENHLFLLGKEVLLDVFILSNCDYLLKAEISAVSQLAVVFSKKIIQTFFIKNVCIITIEKFIKKYFSYLVKIKGLVLHGR